MTETHTSNGAKKSDNRRLEIALFIYFLKFNGTLWIEC